MRAASPLDHEIADPAPGRARHLIQPLAPDVEKMLQPVRRHGNVTDALDHRMKSAVSLPRSHRPLPTVR